MTELTQTAKLPKAAKHKLGRIDGLDFARFIAFFGMVFVNFKIVMLPFDANLGNASWFFSMLEGRAAALFVILAGVGLGLSVQIARLNNETGTGDFVTTTLKRGLLLFIIGMLNSFVFSADILHYYGIYFLFAAFLAPLSSLKIKWLIGLLLLISTAMLLLLDFDKGWNYDLYEYSGFYTLSGGVRNLFYNGWHPVIPWLGFLLFGVLLSRFNMASKQNLNKMLLVGAGVTMVGLALSQAAIMGLFNSNDAGLLELIPLFSTSPLPATLLYMVTAAATACFIIALCILFTKKFAKLGFVKAINIAGRYALTLYIAHIYLGMATMEMAGMLGNSSVSTSILTSILFVFIMAVACNIWSNFFKAGPLEWVMRKIAG